MDLAAFPEAQNDITQAAAANPKGFAALYAAIELDYTTGNYQAALSKTQDALAKIPAPPMELALKEGQLSYLLGYHSLAIRKFMTAIHADPNSPRPGYWSSLLRLEDHEDATIDFHRIVSQVGTRAYLGKVGLFQLGRMAPEALITAANAFPDQQRQRRLCLAYFIIGHQAWLTGDKAAAKQAFQNALQTNQPRMIEYQASKVLLQKISGAN
jgi:lipoprotein NlpI